MTQHVVRQLVSHQSSQVPGVEHLNIEIEIALAVSRAVAEVCGWLDGNRNAHQVVSGGSCIGESLDIRDRVPLVGREGDATANEAEYAEDDGKT